MTNNIFPQITFKSPGLGQPPQMTCEGGITQREMFAAMAMQAICANPDVAFWELGEDDLTGTQVIVKRAVSCADALITELAKADK